MPPSYAPWCSPHSIAPQRGRGAISSTQHTERTEAVSAYNCSALLTLSLPIPDTQAHHTRARMSNGCTCEGAAYRLDVQARKRQESGSSRTGTVWKEPPAG